MTTESIAIIIAGVIGVVSAVLTIWINHYLENRNKHLATKREQFEKVFAPLEILSKVNKMEFNRFLDGSSSEDERNFIEQNVWYPNNSEIKRIIMSHSHLLSEMPQQLYDLVEHINLWLSVYESKYVRHEHEGPVFAGPKGRKYPPEADPYIFAKANEFRKILNK